MTNTKIRLTPKNGKTELKILIAHPMEHGRNRDPDTQELIPAHFINTLRVSRNGKTVLSVQMAGSISKNPYFAFLLNDIAIGDLLRVDWADNHGFNGSAEQILAEPG